MISAYLLIITVYLATSVTAGAQLPSQDSATRPQVQDPKPPRELAQVNTRVITGEDTKKVVRESTLESGAASFIIVVENLEQRDLRDVVDEALLQERTSLVRSKIRRQLDPASQTPSEKNENNPGGICKLALGWYPRDTLEAQLIDRLLLTEVRATVHVLNRDVRRYYEAHKISMAPPESVDLSEILVPYSSPPDADKRTDHSGVSDIETADTRISEAYHKLQAGASFSDVARELSSGPTARGGGPLGSFKRGALSKTIEDQVFQLKAGELTSPIRTRQGVIILRVNSHTLNKIPKFSDIAPSLHEALALTAFRVAARKYLSALRGHAAISIHAGYFDSGSVAMPIDISTLSDDLNLLDSSKHWENAIEVASSLASAGHFKAAMSVNAEAHQFARIVFGDRSYPAAVSANNLAEQYRSLGQYPEAIPLYELAISIYEENSDPSIADSLHNLGKLYLESYHYSLAEPLLRRALNIRRSISSTPPSDLAESLNDIGLLQEALGDYSASISSFEDALRIYKLAPATDSSNIDYAYITGNIAVADTERGDFHDAELLNKDALRIIRQIKGESHPDFALRLNNFGELYLKEGKYRDALRLQERALCIATRAFGDKHPLVMRILINESKTLYLQGDFTKAEKILLSVLHMFGQSDNLEKARVFEVLAAGYQTVGKYVEAENSLKAGMAIYSAQLNTDTSEFANFVNNLGTVYLATGRYREAETLLFQGLEIRERTLGGDHPDVAQSLNNIGDLYCEQGRYPEAEGYLKRALHIVEIKLKPEHPDYGKVAGNLGTLYFQTGNLTAAEPLLTRALNSRKTILGTLHPDVIQNSINLGQVYREMGRYQEAERIFQSALVASRTRNQAANTLGALHGLGQVYLSQERLGEAERLLKAALDSREKLFGPDDTSLTVILSDLSFVYQMEGKNALAGVTFDRALLLLKKAFMYEATFSSEKDQLAFLGTRQEFLPRYMSFQLARVDFMPGAAAAMLDAAMWNKGVVARTTASIYSLLARFGDDNDKRTWEKLVEKKALLALFSRNGIRGTSEASVSLAREINRSEERLVRHLAQSDDNQALDTRWQDVQRVLGPNDVAIEYVSLPDREAFGSKDSAVSVALVLTADHAPVAVRLGHWSEIDAVVRDYLDRIAKVPTADAGRRFYQEMWKPLEKYLPKGKGHIYMAPDGLLREVALPVVPTNDGRILLEKYDLQVLWSTRDLVARREPVSENRAVLIGSPQFAAQSSDLQVLSSNESSSAELTRPEVAASTDCNELTAKHLLCPLPGARRELEGIYEALISSGWTVQEPFTGRDATSEVVKAVMHPKLLHIATHAFYVPAVSSKHDKSVSELNHAEDPMMRSGLYLAGAKAALVGAGGASRADGILTAYEMSTLNLHGTELVVLSACDTGLGELEGSEGMFGLSRALQEAGVQTVLISMWPVPDDTTQEMMFLFYRNWLQGQTKQDALREAQLQMRREVISRWGNEDRPYYWGAFVLVGR